MAWIVTAVPESSAIFRGVRDRPGTAAVPGLEHRGDARAAVARADRPGRSPAFLASTSNDCRFERGTRAVDRVTFAAAASRPGRVPCRASGSPSTISANIRQKRSQVSTANSAFRSARHGERAVSVEAEVEHRVHHAGHADPAPERTDTSSGMSSVLRTTARWRPPGARAPRSPGVRPLAASEPSRGNAGSASVPMTKPGGTGSPAGHPGQPGGLATEAGGVVRSIRSAGVDVGRRGGGRICAPLTHVVSRGGRARRGCPRGTRTRCCAPSRSWACRRTRAVPGRPDPCFARSASRRRR